MELQTVSINDREEIFLDGIAIPNIAAYKLENQSEKEPARLTITIYVNVGQIGSVLQR